ncbi:MAG: DHHA1 domain-containing protein, partial [Niameybacter sp.]
TIEKELNEVAKLTKAKKDSVAKKVEHILAESKELQRENDKIKAEIAKSEAENILDEIQEVAGFKVLVAELPSMDMNGLRNMGDTFKDKLGEGVVVLASCMDEKVSLVAMATNGAVIAGIHCGNIIKTSVAVVNGGGGGRPNMAQAGGKDASKVKEALETAKEIINQQLNK